MAQMTAVQISRPGGPFEVVKREVPAPGPNQVRIKVQACGVCHSDMFVKEGHWPGLHYPRVTGHEVAGVIDEVGSGATIWKKGQRVGVGWHGAHCGQCVPCRRGDFISCRILRITGFNDDGGYAQYMIASANALAAIPDSLSPAEAAPILCAGITTFNSLRHSGARAGNLVAVQGLGGASVILATAPNSKAMSDLVEGLGVGGKLIVVGASADPISVTPIQLIGQRRTIQGWPSGTARDSKDTLNFCALTGIRPMIETFPLEQAAAGYERMLSGKARFRVVLTMN